MSFLILRRLALVASLGLCAAPAFAQNDVSLDNLAIRRDDAKATLTIAHVEATDTNLTTDELARVFAAETPKAERLALLARMAAARLVVSGVVIADNDSKLALEPFEATGIDKGRFKTARLAGAKGEFQGRPDAKGVRHGGGAFTARALTLEDGDLGPLLAAVQSGEVASSGFRISKIAWDGFDGVLTEPDAANREDGQVRVGLRGLTASTDYRDGTPLSTRAEVAGLTVEPGPGSSFGKNLRAFGYDRLDLGLSGSGRYDPASRRLTIDDYTVSAAGAGRLSLSGELTDVQPALLSAADASARRSALTEASLASLTVSFDNEGFVDKAFAYAARERKKSAASLRAETSAMAVQLLPLLLGGDPSSLPLAQSVQSFLANPRNFTLVLKARGVPVPVAQLGAIHDAPTFLALVEVQLSANQ